jgi:zinc/manganese transport system substrate-binding protein
VAAASALSLAACAGTDAGVTDAAVTDDGRIVVVASTNVYGQIAEQIGGDLVDVTSLVSSTAQDPHSFEPSAQDQLRVNRAGLVIENGAGYDGFMRALIAASGTDAPVITAATLSGAWPADAEATDEVEGFNEHVWYDPATMDALAASIADTLTTADPGNAATFAANAAEFSNGIDGLTASLAAIETSWAGAQVFVTEPVPVYLLEAAGLVNATPAEFSEAVEEGQDAPPATLLEALELLRSGSVRVVVANSQTGGAETTQVIDEAQARSIPVLEFSETLPSGDTYLTWMQQNIDDLSSALAR